MHDHASEDQDFRLSPWVSWIVILTLGPLIAYFLATLCGFPATQETLQVILLVEICLLAAAVILLVLVQAIGHWTDEDHEAKEWLRVLTPAPGSLLEELATQPAEWDRRMDTYLRGLWRDVSVGRLRAAVVDAAPAHVPPPIPAARPVSPPPAAAATAPVMNRPNRPAPPPPPNNGPRRAPPGNPPRRNG